MNKLFIVLLFSLTSILYGDNFSKETIDKYGEKYGEKSIIRLNAWDKMMENAKKSDIFEKLKIVNDFFNTIKYMTDIKHWNENDYWATPIEFTGTAAGDCEDYAIAKYFTLIKVGVDESKLRIAYVKLLEKNTDYEQAHMVLLYYHQPSSAPVVLDNVIKKLQLSSSRDDLSLVYSFNANGLWEAKNKGKDERFVGANKLAKWKDLIDKK
jgi:predicted transglutaminase-like cysteine proteinase